MINVHSLFEVSDDMYGCTILPGGMQLLAASGYDSDDIRELTEHLCRVSNMQLLFTYSSPGGDFIALGVHEAEAVVSIDHVACKREFEKALRWAVVSQPGGFSEPIAGAELLVA